MDGSVRSSARNEGERKKKKRKLFSYFSSPIYFLQAIDDFRSENAFVFLLSTRAGGVGLNLTAASVVIFYDSDWNPMADMQAAGRAHRIGQTQEVLVIRLVCPSTIDEIVTKRAEQKRALANTVVDEGRMDGEPKLNAKQMLEILS